MNVLPGFPVGNKVHRPRRCLPELSVRGYHIKARALFYAQVIQDEVSVFFCGEERIPQGSRPNQVPPAPHMRPAKRIAVRIIDDSLDRRAPAQQKIDSGQVSIL